MTLFVLVVFMGGGEGGLLLLTLRGRSAPHQQAGVYLPGVLLRFGALHHINMRWYDDGLRGVE